MSDQSAPAPTDNNPKYEPWTPPDHDQEFVFKDIASAPAWVDKSWASFSAGPAIALPAGDLFGTGPYHTKFARVGDTVLFKAAQGSKPAHFEVVEGDASTEEGIGTKKIPMATNASLEDMLKIGTLTPDELGSDAKAQVAARSPGLATMIETGRGAPEAQSASDHLKLD